MTSQELGTKDGKEAFDNGLASAPCLNPVAMQRIENAEVDNIEYMKAYIRSWTIANINAAVN